LFDPCASGAVDCNAKLQSAMPHISAGGEKSSLLRSNSGAKPSRAHPPSPCQRVRIFSLSGARPEVKAGPSPARSDPRQPQPSLTLWYRRRRLVGLRWGTGSRRARSCGPSFPEGKLLISAEPVEVEIERTEELISRQQALNNLKLHRLGVIGTLGSLCTAPRCHHWKTDLQF
jgi:hypothetical protein